jgi:hypothetical protein
VVFITDNGQVAADTVDLMHNMMLVSTQLWCIYSAS